MTKRLTAEEVKATLKSNPAYETVVQFACMDAHLPVGSKERNVCRECAARLYADAWFDESVFACGDPGGVVSPEDYIEIHTRQAFNECVRYGIIPGGLIGTLLFYAIRQAAWRFLSYLVQEWWRQQMTTQLVKKSIDDSRWGL